MILSFVLDILSKISPITRLIMMSVFGVGLLINLEIWDELSLHYDYSLIFEKGEYWRLYTSIFFIGKFETGPLVSLFMLYQYSSGLEDNSFRSKSADYFLIIVLVMLSLIGISYFTNEPFVHSISNKIFLLKIKYHHD